MMSRDAAANSAGLRAVPIGLDEVPGHADLFLSFLQDTNSSNNVFWPNRDEPLASYANIVLERYETDREALCSLLQVENSRYGATEETLANIELLRNKSSVAVITGQQAGFLGGPAYTVYKALTAIRIAEELNGKGVKAVPVFWIAAEDHDFAEISSAGFRGKDGGLITGSITQRAEEEELPVGKIRIGDQTSETLDRVFEGIPETRFSNRYRDLAIECYEPGVTLGEAFGRLLTRLVGNYGLVLVDPMNAEFRELSSPIIASSIDQLDALRDRLFERQSALKRNGFASQVHVSEEFVPLFVFDESGKRKALELSQNKDAIKTKDGGHRFTRSELKEIAEAEPARLSPNALLRPVVQDAVFPTVCYVGGAAEICYFAQNSAIYEVLQRPATPIRHRSAFTVFEARHHRTMQAYGVGIKDIFRGRESVLQRIAAETADPETMQLFDETYRLFESQLEKCEMELIDSAPDVASNLIKRRKKVLWHIKVLREKFASSQARRNSDMTRRTEDLFNQVLPEGALQERTVSYLDFLNLHGPGFTGWLMRHVKSQNSQHICLFL